MNKIGYLANDRLRCIEGTMTFWDFLLHDIPGLIDMTGGYTPYYELAHNIERAIKKQRPDYIIRNASYFRKINTNVPTISLLQDINLTDECQHEVLNASTVVVANSQHTANLYKDIIKTPVRIIPLGVDEQLFKPGPDCSKELGIGIGSILFVGAATSIKGFSLLMDIVNSTAYNFVFVMKDDFKTDHPRIKVFNRADEQLMVKIYNSCKIVLCTSEQETQHLTTLESWSCNLPTIGRRVGVYNEIADTVGWGLIANDLSDFIKAIRMTFEYIDCFKPRQFFLGKGFDMKTCMNRWKDLVQEICYE